MTYFLYAQMMMMISNTAKRIVEQIQLPIIRKSPEVEGDDDPVVELDDVVGLKLIVVGLKSIVVGLKLIVVGLMAGLVVVVGEKQPH